MTLYEAREQTRQTRAMARRGEDPKAGAPGKSDTFKTVVERFTLHKQFGKEDSKSVLKSQSVMLHHCKEWHGRPVATIRQGEIDKVLELVLLGDGDKLKPRRAMALRLYTHLRDFFGWCVSKNIIKSSPMANMKKPCDKPEPRNRVWFKEEAADAAIKALWRTADEIGGDEGRYIKLMVLTGKRRTALANMKWEDIKPKQWGKIKTDWHWDVPEVTKTNKRLHAVTLPPLAQQILHPRQQNGRVFTIASLDRLQSRVRQLSGIEDFIWHGIRHLVETKCAELRDDDGKALIPPNIRDRLFDHVSQRGAGAGYDHHHYKPEMKDALEIWASYVKGLVHPEGNVVPLHG